MKSRWRCVDGAGTAQARVAHDLAMLCQWKDGLGITRAKDAEQLVRTLGKTARDGGWRVWLTIAFESRGAIREPRITKSRWSTAMTDLPGYEFTICAVAQRGRTAAKTIIRRADGTLHKREYDNVTYWSLIALTAESPNADLATVARRLAGADATAAMATVLRTLAGMRDLMIVIGAPRPGHDPKRPCRRLWADVLDERTRCSRCRAPGCRSTATMSKFRTGSAPATACPRRRPISATTGCRRSSPMSNASPRRPRAAALMGRGIARLQMFFLLDQVHELARLRSWGVAAQRAGLPVDPAVLQAGQPIYTARPSFINMNDPVPEEHWAFVLPGASERVSLVADRYDVVSAAIERKVSRPRR